MTLGTRTAGPGAAYPAPMNRDARAMGRPSGRRHRRPTGSCSSPTKPSPTVTIGPVPHLHRPHHPRVLIVPLTAFADAGTRCRRSARTLTACRANRAPRADGRVMRDVTALDKVRIGPMFERSRARPVPFGAGVWRAVPAGGGERAGTGRRAGRRSFPDALAFRQGRAAQDASAISGGCSRRCGAPARSLLSLSIVLRLIVAIQPPLVLLFTKLIIDEVVHQTGLGVPGTRAHRLARASGRFTFLMLLLGGEFVLVFARDAFNRGINVIDNILGESALERRQPRADAACRQARFQAFRAIRVPGQPGAGPPPGRRALDRHLAGVRPGAGDDHRYRARRRACSSMRRC